jgi:hypothetical protein
MKSGGGLAGGEADVPNFRYRLTRAQQRIYDRSNAMPAVPLQATPALRQAVALLPTVLQTGNVGRVELLSQRISDEIAALLHVRRVRVQVSGTRPSNTRGELHGLYTPAHNGTAATIKLWMMTAKRQQVVAFRTVLRTLLHEICHHLDYALLGLADSFHTDGFYQRESSLFYRIGGPAAAARSGRHDTASRPELSPAATAMSRPQLV